MNPTVVESRSGIPIGRIIATGLIAAILDAVAAMLVYQVQPRPLFLLIASGAFGESAFTGSPEMVMAGVLFISRLPSAGPHCISSFIPD